MRESERIREEKKRMDEEVKEKERIIAEEKRYADINKISIIDYFIVTVGYRETFCSWVNDAMCLMVQLLTILSLFDVQVITGRKKEA